MTRLINRISKLEKNVKVSQLHDLLTLTINYIDKHGFEDFYEHCCNNDYDVTLEHIFASLHDVFDVEHYRGKIPDEVVKEMYRRCQNHAYQHDKKIIIRERMNKPL